MPFLDETTGMPVLPEGQRWEVRPNVTVTQTQYGGQYGPPKLTTAYVLELQQRESYTENLSKVDGWWKGIGLRAEAANHPNKLAYRIRGRVRDRSVTYDAETTMATYTYWVPIDRRDFDKLIERDIREWALDILAKRAEHAESVAREERLLGVYPPHSLLPEIEA